MNSYKIIDQTPPNAVVSIATVTYNHEKFIAEAIESVINQKTNFPIQLVIAEDFSTDKTREIVLQYQRKFPDIIKLILQNKNVGAIQNNSDLLSNLSGKYIAALEGDDYWTDPYKLQKQVDFLEVNSEYGLVITDFNILNQSTGSIEESLFKNQPTKFPFYTNFEDFLYAAAYMAPCTWLLRKEFVCLQPRGHVDGTFALLLDVLAKSKVGFISDTTSVYRVLEESASHSDSIEKKYLRSVGLLKTQLDYIVDYKLSESFKFKVLQKHYGLLLPILVVLGKSEEIIKAAFYLPKEERNYKDRCFFFFAKIPFASKLMLFLYLLKIRIIKIVKK